MDVSYLLDSLNDKQREAVAAKRTNMLVLAGAGSGKTRVLVHRIAWLQSVENCSPYSIMAVTFTNKAAAEMRHRIAQLMGTSQGGMWVGTFHGLAHRLLRAHHLDANLPQDFQILDSEDQLRLLKRLIKAMNLDEKQWPPRQAMWFINSQKDEGLRPHHLQSYGNPVEQNLAEGLSGLPGGLRPRRAGWISPSCCCAPTSCGSTNRIFFSTIVNASPIFWWTNSRIPTTSNTRGSVCWRGIPAR
ncbi:DNA helicase II [Kluyvera cryocrescens]|uniref:DNA 3'-5' helicase II n=1 Tax=Kluyvera cryocrescens TaxID=580 RepID=A0A485B5E9_KLUCR|nr:DNA helicase II [Kluyvera cryocrescens]